MAFIVGNSDYENLPDIEQAKRQADLVARALKSSGFEVFTAIDDQRLAFDEKFHDFVRVLKGADATFFYYSGHSVQIDGQDRIVPVDALVTKAADLESQTIDLAEILLQMRRRTRLQIVIIEACHDDPFPKIAYYLGSHPQPLPTTPGCAKKSPEAGVLIMQANEPGNPVTGVSPFTDDFVSRAFLPNEDIHDAILQVRKDTIDQTDGGQVPYFVSALDEMGFYLNNGESHAATPVGDQSAKPKTGAEQQTKPVPVTPPIKIPPPKQKDRSAKKKAPAAKPSSVEQSAPNVPEFTRPNARTFSYSVWSPGNLRSGLRTRQITKYGVLSCVATLKVRLGVENARMCKWE